MEVTVGDAAPRLERWLEEGRALQRRLVLRSRPAAVEERCAEVRALSDQLARSTPVWRRHGARTVYSKTWPSPIATSSRTKPPTA